MYLKSGSWPEISDIEFNLLKYAQEATPLLAKLSKKKRSSWPLHVEIFCSNCCPSGSSLPDVILPTSMLIMNFRNRAGEDPKEVTANLFRLFILVQLLSMTELERNACYVRRLEFRRIKSIAEKTQQEQEPGKTCGSFRARSIH